MITHLIEYGLLGLSGIGSLVSTYLLGKAHGANQTLRQYLEAELEKDWAVVKTDVVAKL